MGAVAERNRTSGTNAADVFDVVATVPEWWAARARAAGLPRSWQDWRRALPDPPEPLVGSPLRALVDASPTALGEAYVSALDRGTRLREGRHYTPEQLARVLWSEIEMAGYENGLVVDSACGGGALLLPPLRRLMRAADDPAAALAAVAQSIRGTDTDEIAVWMGNAILNAELLPLWAAVPEHRRPPLAQLLHVADGLAPADDRPLVVVMNPPYGRVRLSSEERGRWEESLFGHANRYALFLHAAIERAAPGGLVAAIVPTSFLGGAYYQRLRRLIVREAPLERLTFVDARAGVFDGGVLQETCLAILRKGGRSAPVACSQLSVNGSVELTELPRAPRPRVGPSPWLLPRHPNDRNLVRIAGTLDARLGDYGWKASTGPLVWNRHKPQIHAAPGPGRLPILWAADIDHSEIRRDPARDHQRWIALRPQDEFMKTTEPALLVQRTTAPEQRRRLIATRLDADTLAAWGGAVVVENHVNVLRCSTPRSPLTAPLLERMLNTPTLDRLYRCLTGTVAVSAYELEALPLPAPQVIRGWRDLSSDELTAVVASYYGDAAS
jgi:adenine-specific DNA-methyltransferase